MATLIAVLIPVLGRTHRIVPLMESIASSTSESHRTLFLASPYDEKQLRALAEVGADFHVCPDWPSGQGQFARKINLGYRLTEEPWLLLGASDLVFEPGWDREALAEAERSGAGIIGTNDCANPAVLRGTHSTHPLLRRAYVEEFGSATFDGSGEVYCPLYDHQYVDTEAVVTARMRGRWAFAQSSVVRHLHPLWGTAEMDDTYRRALREGAADHQLFRQRMTVLREQAGRSRRALRALR